MTLVEDRSILADRPIARRPNTTYELGRVCEYCPTVLSRYNPVQACALHSGYLRIIGDSLRARR